MKKILSAIIILASLAYFFAPYDHVPTAQGGEKDVVYQALKATGAQFCDYTLQGWVQVNHEYLSPEALQSLVGETALALGLEKDQLEEQFMEGQGMATWGAQGRSDGVDIVLQAQTLEPGGEDPEGHPETYLMVEARTASLPDTALTWKEKLTAALKAYDPDPQVSVLFIGTIAGKVEEATGKSLLEEAFRRVQAEKVEGIEDGSLISWSGLAPHLEDYLMVGDRPINLNLAMRYHNLDDKTYVYAGSPLIFSEY